MYLFKQKAKGIEKDSVAASYARAPGFAKAASPDATWAPDPPKDDRAILAVYNNGLSAFMDDLMEFAERHPHAKRGPAKVIGDAARAEGSGYEGMKVGKSGAAR